MKKALSAVLVLMLLVSLMPTAAFADNGDYETVTGTIMFNAGHDDSETDHPCPFTYSDGYFAESGYGYRQDLASVTMAMCLAAGNVADPARYREGPANLADFFEQIGFEGFEANPDFTERPGRNTFGVGIANKQITVGGESCTVIGIGLRGCGYYAEWAGDLNVGLSGDHTGFAICRDTALAFLRQYLLNHPEISGRIKVWCTGYSRGAAGANMLGGKLDDMIMSGESLGKNVTLSAEDVYIYTFEAPMGADASAVGGRVYNNIHNIINYNDLVVRVAPECMGFARYGVDHVMPSEKLDDDYASLKAGMLEVFNTFENAGKYRIDDFKYVTVTPGATADKIIRSIKGDVMTQGEFLDTFVEKLFTKVFTTREEVYAAQGDIQEIVLPLIGTYPEQWDTVKQSLAENAKDNLARIMAALIKGEDTAVNVIADIVLDAMRDAGITEYNAQQVRQMIRPLVKMLVKIASACPDELATLLYNVVGIMSAHYGELGMSWMLSIPTDYMTGKQQTQQPAGELPFADVPVGAWYRDELKYAYDNGLIQGTDECLFDPDGLVTRGQVVTVLYRIAGEPPVNGKTCPFTDLDAEWSRDAIIWAYNAGIANGFSETRFGENAGVTREQLAAFMYRYADKLVYFGETKVPADFNGSFADSDYVSDYAKNAMLWANGAGIIKGNADGTLAPGGTATRAEFACMMARFHKLCAVKF